MPLGRARNSSKRFVPPKLMITSLMDMFTIILIFLLFSFSNNPEKMQLDKDMELPQSSSKKEYQKTVTIILSRENLRVDGEIVGTVEGGKILGIDPEKLDESTLFEKLKAQKTNDDSEESGDDEEKTDHILFLCDKSHSFDTINAVIKTSGLAGYPNFQFAVLEEKK